MTFEIPDPELDQGYEDTESIDNDIDSLYNKFIRPIDSLRSIAEPPKDQNQSNQSEPQAIQNLSVDAINGTESRIHAFYRLLGLPVVGGTSFYNPGFDPNPKSQKTRIGIDQKVSSDDLSMMQDREQHFKTFSQMFAGQGFDSTVYGLCQQIPKSFKLTEGEETEIGDRALFLEKANPYLSTSMQTSLSAGADSFKSRFGYPITSFQHILAPFMVNPAIDYTVMPMNNKVCVPFLKNKQATLISKNPDVYLKRCGLEFIIRARLKDNIADATFLSNLEQILTKIKTPTTDLEGSLDANSLRSTLQAFAADSEVADIDLQAIFEGFSSTQATVIGQLIKTIKVAVKLLSASRYELSVLQDFQNGITFLPISSGTGFENGGSNRNYTGTALERDITIVSMKKLNSDRDILADRELGDFATAQFVNLEKSDTYSKQLSELKNKKTELDNKAIRNLRTIEIICGESTGCGLIDILAIYTALWSIKIEDLLNLLDQDSAERLFNFNVSLRSDAVSKRISSPQSITSTLTNLEDKIASILSFVDYLYTESFSSIKNNESGSPT